MPDDRQPPPDEPLPTEEELVAYLDGELDETQEQAIELLIAKDDATRRKVEALKKTYDLLDYLPQPEPSPTFATRTLTQIQPVPGNATTTALPPSPPGNTTQLAPSLTATYHGLPPKPKNLKWQAAFWLLAACLATVLGYFAHLLARPHLESNDAAKRTSEQVRLLERLPLYLGVDDLEMVKQLDHPDLFGETDTDEMKAVIETLTSSEVEKLENIFKAYPVSRQQQLRKLDEELSELDTDLQTHFLSVLERYAIWLDRLPDNYRKEVLIAPAAVERLNAIRIVKSRVWREGLPMAIREKIDQAEPPKRDELIAELKQQDAKRRELWVMARREWRNLTGDRRPWPFDNEALAKQVEEHVEKRLKPRLKDNEASELDQTRKETTTPGGYFAWYRYGDFILKMQEVHPSLPEASGKVVRTSNDLPDTFLMQLQRAAPLGAKRQLRNHPTSGKWPDFAEHVLKEATDLKVTIRFSLGPTKWDEYTEPVKQFGERELLPKLAAKDQEELKKHEGAPWPEHSRKLLEFAKKQNLSVPTVTLPGSPSQWEHVYRNRPGKK